DLVTKGQLKLIQESESVRDLLLDGDDNTCHNELRSLNILWTSEYVFTWMRIITDKP
ncbi:hypothetical protein BgiMline_035976, partial [Biomphalaria glabrata]